MSTTIRQTLKNTKFFQHCSPECLDKLASQANIIDFPKHKIIFVNGEHADRFYLITKGWIKLFRETVGGAQSIIDILTEKHIFGEIALFQDDSYPFSAESAERSQVISLPLSELKTEIEKNAKFSMDMMRSMARYQKQQDQEIENRTLKNAPQRIGCFLLRLLPKGANGAVVIKLPYDKTLVASRLGMQPETFSRALNKLKSNVKMTVHGSEIEVNDVKELVNYACAVCSSEFPCSDLPH